MTGPPLPPKIEKIDFSEFHPLDHNLLQCRGYPGGWRTHLKFRWEFFVAPALERQTFCRIGRHRRYGDAWHGQEYLGRQCGACHKPKERTDEQELRRRL